MILPLFLILRKPLNLVYAVDDLAEKVYIYNKLFSQALELYVPLSKVTRPPSP